ncbi:MAG: hypothetical protein JSV69_11635 [Chloroflexota bacterium]|nr:MAG: hypothetical protein JSV69_11635 [Chloroflexota bacterium]UCF27602.1 MAG: hypothetical protein JSW42_13375 [Chloroflexota bacterium]
MDSQSSPSVRTFIPAALILALIGWGGLYALLNFTIPTVGPRWLFFFLSVLALTGTSLPIVAFLNQRFPSTPPVSSGVIVREALWIGIYFPTLAWLQLGRVLTPALIMLLAIGFIAIEILLRLRERSQWKPQ